MSSLSLQQLGRSKIHFLPLSVDTSAETIHSPYIPSYVQSPLKKNQFYQLKQFFLTFNFYLGYFNLLFFFLTGCNIDIYIPSRMHFLVEINNFGCGASPLFTQYHYIENHT